MYFNLPTAFTHLPYCIIGSVANDWDDYYIASITIDYNTMTKFACKLGYGGTAYSKTFNWITIGY